RLIDAKKSPPFPRLSRMGKSRALLSGADYLLSDYLLSESRYAAPAVAPVTAKTAGHAPIFLASGCDAPKAPTYSAVRPTVVGTVVFARQERAAQPPAAASTAPPRGPLPLSRAVMKPSSRPALTTVAVLTFFAFVISISDMFL